MVGSQLWLSAAVIGAILVPIGLILTFAPRSDARAQSQRSRGKFRKVHKGADAEEFETARDRGVRCAEEDGDDDDYGEEDDDEHDQEDDGEGEGGEDEGEEDDLQDVDDGEEDDEEEEPFEEIEKYDFGRK